jgi:hypothetical protein
MALERWRDTQWVGRKCINNVTEGENLLMEYVNRRIILNEVECQHIKLD